MKKTSPKRYLVGASHWSETLSDFSLGKYTQFTNLLYLVGKWAWDKFNQKDYHDCGRYLKEMKIRL
jgi:hypothetical protein